MTITSMPHPRLLTGSRRALERHLADEVRAQRARDPLAPLPIVVGGTLMRPYLRRRLAELTGGHLNVRLMTVGELGLRLGHGGSSPRGGGRCRSWPIASSRSRSRSTRAGTSSRSRRCRASRRCCCARCATCAAPGSTPRRSRAAVAASRDPTGKLAALAALYADHERRRAGFFSSEDGLAVADPRGARRRPAARLRRLGAVGAAAVRARRAERRASRSRCCCRARRGDRPRHGRSRRLVDWAAARGARPSARRRRDRRRRRPAPRDRQRRARLGAGPDARGRRRRCGACLRWATAGIAFHEMAVVYRQSEPYRPLLEAAFREAGIPTYLHEGTPLTERPLGRRIAALLDLVDGDLERATVMTFLADARLPSETWERYGRVSADGLGHRLAARGRRAWRGAVGERLAAAARGARGALRGGSAAVAAPSAWSASTRCGAFVADLDARLRSRRERASWQEHLAWLRDLLTTYVADAGAGRRRARRARGARHAVRRAAVRALPRGGHRPRSKACAPPTSSTRAAGRVRRPRRRAARRQRGAPPRLRGGGDRRHRRAPVPAAAAPGRAAARRTSARSSTRATAGRCRCARWAPTPSRCSSRSRRAAADRALQLSVPRTQDGETRPVLPSTFLLDAAARRRRAARSASATSSASRPSTGGASAPAA